MADPRTLLLTRPRAQSEAFAAVLAARLPGRFRPVDLARSSRSSPAGAARPRRRAGADLHLGQRGGAVRRPHPRPQPAGLVRGRDDRRGGAAGGLRGALGGRRRGATSRRSSSRRTAPAAGDFLHLRGRACGGRPRRPAGGGGRAGARGGDLRPGAATPDRGGAGAARRRRDRRADVLLAAHGPALRRRRRAAPAGISRARVAVSLSAAADAAFAGPGAGAPAASPRRRPATGCWRRWRRCRDGARRDARIPGAIGLLRQNAWPSIAFAPHTGAGARTDAEKEDRCDEG